MSASHLSLRYGSLATEGGFVTGTVPPPRGKRKATLTDGLPCIRLIRLLCNYGTFHAISCSIGMK